MSFEPLRHGAILLVRRDLAGDGPIAGGPAFLSDATIGTSITNASQRPICRAENAAEVVG